MRKTLVVSLVLCVVAVFAYAQTGLGADTAAKPAKKSATAYKGYVQGTDPAAKSFNISSCPACQDIITLYVNADTKYSPKGTGWDDLKKGAHVSGKSKTAEDKRWAVTVNFLKEKGDAHKTGSR
jgi:hypothetical protein